MNPLSEPNLRLSDSMLRQKRLKQKKSVMKLRHLRLSVTHLSLFDRLEKRSHYQTTGFNNTNLNFVHKFV